MYKFIYLGNNSIGDNGCELLSKANWQNLTYLNLGKIFIYADQNNIDKSNK
jgi:hypothetical protein